MREVIKSNHSEDSVIRICNMVHIWKTVYGISNSAVPKTYVGIKMNFKWI